MIIKKDNIFINLLVRDCFTHIHKLNFTVNLCCFILHMSLFIAHKAVSVYNKIMMYIAYLDLRG